MSNRKIIVALQVSLDGLIEGPNGEVDWIANWDDPFEVLPEIDTCVLGGGMYPGYEDYWLAILADPEAVLELTGRKPSPEEVAYARFAERTPHVVLSRRITEVRLKSARIARDIAEIRSLKSEAGGDVHAVGGAAFVSSLMNEGLVDEIRLTVHPLVLGAGKPLFKDVRDRHRSSSSSSEPLRSGRVSLVYAVLDS